MLRHCLWPPVICRSLSASLEPFSEKTHPAFIVDGVEYDEIYISVYPNCEINGKPYSLPYQKPWTNITNDDAAKACFSKGEGWHLLTAAEWGLLADTSLMLGTKRFIRGLGEAAHNGGNACVVINRHYLAFQSRLRRRHVRQLNLFSRLFRFLFCPLRPKQPLNQILVEAVNAKTDAEFRAITPPSFAKAFFEANQ